MKGAVQLMDVACFGHICLDMNPEISAPVDMRGGKLTNIGKMNIHTGGSVANTGLALTRLGLDVGLFAGVGDDSLAQLTTALIRREGGDTEHLITIPGSASSYTIVLSPPGVDRMLLHHPGVNDEIGPDAIDFHALRDVRLLHFGYPTLMRQFYQNNGEQFIAMMTRAYGHAQAISVDMTLPDPDTPSGKANWFSILAQSLPCIDIFMPSIEETIYMFDRPHFDELIRHGDIIPQLDLEYVAELGRTLLDHGCNIVLLKCGELGIYASSRDADCIRRTSARLGISLDDWADREFFMPAFHVDQVKSAVGAGDTCIAGFIASMLAGDSFQRAVEVGCAVGALCVMNYSAIGGIPDLAEVKRLIDAGWQKNDNPFCHAIERRQSVRRS